MPEVDFIYDDHCPNVAEARSQLMHAFKQTGIEPRWNEWRAGSPEAPKRTQGFGSPTILVDGVDVAGATPSGSGEACRIYLGDGGRPSGVPAVETIAAALRGEARPGDEARPGRLTVLGLNLGVLPGVGVALLPKVACPACWPAYAGVLSSLGLGFLMDAAYLLPLTAAFLVVAVGALAFRARQRRGYGPFLLGLAAGAVVLVGKFVFGSDPAMYAGIALLVGASFWNTWPVKAASCPSCASGAGSPGVRGERA